MVIQDRKLDNDLIILQTNNNEKLSMSLLELKKNINKQKEDK